VGEFVKAYGKWPDRRVEQVWNGDGEPTGAIETRMVPHDL